MLPTASSTDFSTKNFNNKSSIIDNKNKLAQTDRTNYNKK